MDTIQEVITAEHVLALLDKELVHQDTFFRQAQEDLVTTVADVVLPIYPTVSLTELGQLMLPARFRLVCQEIINGQVSSALTDDSKQLADIKMHYEQLSADEVHHLVSKATQFLEDVSNSTRLLLLNSIGRGVYLCLDPHVAVTS